MVCEQCGKEFDGRKRKYCSPECRRISNSKRRNSQYIKYWHNEEPPRVLFSEALEYTCPICKKKFIPAPYHAYQVKGKPLCSYRCYVQALEGKK